MPADRPLAGEGSTSGDGPAAATAAVGVVVGNLRPRSRTRTVAEAVAEAAARAAGLADTDRLVVDLIDLGPQLFDWSSTEVRATAEAVARCPLLVVASPVYKASITGLLKAFLDWFGTTGLEGVTAVPVTVGAAADHALAVEVHLRPVLVEIGATVPTRGLHVLESQLEELDTLIDRFIEREAPRLAASIAGSPLTA